MSRSIALRLGFAVLASGALALAAAESASPLAGSRCNGTASIDATFREAALDQLDSLVIHTPGQNADGAIRSDHGTGLLDARHRGWSRISAYQVNLGLVGALAVGPRALPLAGDWLRWQARHIALRGPTRGIVIDTWVQAETHEESTCPPGVGASICDAVDAFDSTAASTLLMADAYLRAGGEARLVRDPAMRDALESAAAALHNLGDGHGFTVAKPSHPVAYLMDQVEVAAGLRAWARLQTVAYAQPASAANTDALAARLEHDIRDRFRRKDGWNVALDPKPLEHARWYPDTVAQAWPLLWLPEDPSQPDNARAIWRSAIGAWQRDTQKSWSTSAADPDGFLWPAIAVAALCSGDTAEAARWVARVRRQLLGTASPAFDAPFHIGDLLWLLWMAMPAVDASHVVSTR